VIAAGQRFGRAGHEHCTHRRVAQDAGERVEHRPLYEPRVRDDRVGVRRKNTLDELRARRDELDGVPFFAKEIREHVTKPRVVFRQNQSQLVARSRLHDSEPVAMVDDVTSRRDAICGVRSFPDASHFHCVWEPSSDNG
jgi:hypothetical protein